MKLKVEFDHNHGESMYSSDKSKQAEGILRVRDDDLVKDMDDGKKVIDLDEKNSDYRQE